MKFLDFVDVTMEVLYQCNTIQLTFMSVKICRTVMKCFYGILILDERMVM